MAAFLMVWGYINVLAQADPMSGNAVMHLKHMLLCVSFREGLVHFKNAEGTNTSLP